MITAMTGEYLYANCTFKKKKNNCKNFISNLISDSTQNINLKSDF